jgi:signal transduction histidine kinase/CheY-like chemotaxis protein/AraC-like DNA-binding protein
VICSILGDNNGNLWLSTHSGISKLKIAENEFLNYYVFDGLQGNEFSMGAAFKSKDGEMFFGGTGGITSFYPAEIGDRKTSLNLYLTGLYLADKPVISGQKSGRNTIFTGFISDVDTIRLSYDDNMFALEFSTFNYGFSEQIAYQYMLEGLNSEWVSTEPGVNRIYFTNIHYGTYRLKIRAFFYSNYSSEKIITLIISPPWYLTVWAKLGYLLLFVLLVWGISRFIMERIRHRQELMRSEHAEQISEAKLQFFINISHEIRTPMTLIISPLEKLISECKDQAQQKVYLLIYRNAQRILQLINQLMDLRKIDKGSMSMKFRETDIVSFIDDLMQTFEYQAEKQNIRFSFVHADEQLKVWIDLNNFDKVLVNLLSNAFKYTPENGEITVTLRRAANDYEIIVSDTGPGIEEDQLEKIFERFYQINTDETKNIFGTGVGLHLARSLVELQHGTISARNRTDARGSEFIICLPLGNAHLSNIEEVMPPPATAVPFVRKEMILPKVTQDASEQVTKSRKPRPKTKYRVLIVDDENEIRQYLKEALSENYRISEALNGKEALNFILKEKPDLVISDVMMPEMDGIALTKKVKANVTVNHIPIILLTAKTSDEDKAAGFDTGADAYIAKPFNIDLLQSIVSNIFENRERLKPRAVDSEENRELIEPVVLKPSDQVLYEKIIKIINANISDPDLNVELLAHGVGMSRVHMHRKLKELTNQSARDFIKTIRLKQAGELLTNPKLTISEVAYALGFTNMSHFSNSFREFYGVSPKEYRGK